MPTKPIKRKTKTPLELATAKVVACERRLATAKDNLKKAVTEMNKLSGK